MPFSPSLSRRSLIGGAAGFAATACLPGGLATAAEQLLMEKVIGNVGNLFGGVTLGEEHERLMATQWFAPIMERHGGMYPSAAAQRSLQAFAAPLYAASKRTFLWEIAVLSSNEVLALAIPAGKILVTRGLMSYVDSEEELASIIAHEMGHAELSHHLAEIRSRMAQDAILSTVVDVLNHQKGADARTAGQVIDALKAPLLDIMEGGYSRENELAADAFIPGAFRAAGLDPATSSLAWHRLLRLYPPDAGASSLFASHPQMVERIDALEAAAGPSTGQRGFAGSEAFRQLKSIFPTRPV
ncbi:M48 family metalloprotease [Caenispirillum bisanense]|uniref:M48 family metalloprotease n=1 Tax=Caenispirillum bisanense TaxID=414052 RepID=UPI0031D50BF9